jgi:hypothetical protein
MCGVTRYDARTAGSSVWRFRLLTCPWQLASAGLRACDASAQAEKQSLAKQAAGEGKKEPASSPLPGGFQTHVRSLHSSAALVALSMLAHLTAAPAHLCTAGCCSACFSVCPAGTAAH